MANQDLEKQLAGLFNNLTESETTEEQIPDQLAQIFSTTAEPELPSVPQTQEAQPASPDTKPVSPEPAPSPPTPPAQERQTVEEPPTPRPVETREPSPRQSRWANDPMLRMAADSNEPVAKLALETLVNMGDVVRQRVLGLAQQPTAPLHDGVAAYISYVLGQPMIYVPPGTFTMGSDLTSDPLAEPHEQPEHQLSLPGYWIARHPVTVAQFQAFVNDSGYHPIGTHSQEGEAQEPVVDVTWYDILVYCKWLTTRSKLPVTLPSEAQWEKAARGQDGRRYPWGNTPPTPSLCNFDRSVVGRYSPQGDGPYGCSDMAGNVWEWTRSIYRPYPYRAADGREDLNKKEPRVIRGLTFNNLAQFTRCACRYNLKQNLHLLTLGFRVVVDPTLA